MKFTGRLLWQQKKNSKSGEIIRWNYWGIRQQNKKNIKWWWWWWWRGKTFEVNKWQMQWFSPVYDVCFLLLFLFFRTTVDCVYDDWFKSFFFFVFLLFDVDDVFLFFFRWCIMYWESDDDIRLISNQKKNDDNNGNR